MQRQETDMMYLVDLGVKCFVSKSMFKYVSAQNVLSSGYMCLLDSPMQMI